MFNIAHRPMSHLKRHIIVRLLFLVIGLVLTAHQVVPHHHHNELSEEEHVGEHTAAHTFWEYLQLAFHQELGDDDLTTSTRSAEDISDIAAYFCLPTLFSFHSEILLEAFSTTFSSSGEIVYQTHFYLLSNQFRAPPAV